MLRIQAKSKLLMIGDSITDCERARPVGEGLFGAVGKGYVALIDAAFGAACPERRIRVVNMGCSGNTARDLKTRWQNDVLAHKPDWLSIMIGINDVWRQFDLPLQPHTHVYPDEYEATLDELIRRTKPALQGLVLATPYFIEPNRADAMRARMDEYGTIVRKLARKHKAILVDTQAAFDQVLKTVYPATLAWDRVHPTLVGHTIIARAFLDAMGFDG